MPVGSKNFRIALKRILSSGRLTMTCGCKNIGSLINTPKSNRRKMIAGFFCLNIPITDNGPVCGFSYNQLWQSKYSYDKDKV